MLLFAARSLRIRRRGLFELAVKPIERLAAPRTVFFSSHGAGGGGGNSGTGPTEDLRARNVQLGLYALAGAIAVAGASYAAVPLYQAFCQATGYGGTTQEATEAAFAAVRPVAGAQRITVRFSAETSSSMPWTFVPQQASVSVLPGETALAFYRAHNPTGAPVTGVSTYNVAPARAGLYFSKIQCFCFEEQRLRPHEEIDMPVFFYVDPAILDDPVMKKTKSITLNYTFFRADELKAVDISTEYAKREAAAAAARARVAGSGARSSEAQAAVDAWAAEVAARIGAPSGKAAPLAPAPAAPAADSRGAAAIPA